MSGVTHYAFCLSKQPQSLIQFQGEEKQTLFPEVEQQNSERVFGTKYIAVANFEKIHSANCCTLIKS